MVKATSLASIITMMEVTGLARKLIAETYRSVEIFACAELIHLALTLIITAAQVSDLVGSIGAALDDTLAWLEQGRPKA